MEYGDFGVVNQHAMDGMHCNQDMFKDKTTTSGFSPRNKLGTRCEQARLHALQHAPQNHLPQIR